jgi:hypothetical protein
MRWIAAMCLGCFIGGCLGIEGTDVSTGQDVQSTGDGSTSGPGPHSPPTATSVATTAEDSGEGTLSAGTESEPEVTETSAGTSTGEIDLEDLGTDTDTGTETGTGSESSTGSTGAVDDGEG